MRRVAFSILGLYAVIAIALAPRADAAGDELPHFASLKSGEVNMRTGPGRQYPIEWVYQRRGLPLEVIAEFDQWRQVRDHEGATGWIHQSLLSSQRMVLIRGAERRMRDAPREDARVVLRAGSGVLGALLACESRWCRVEIEGIRGWLGRGDMWGIYPTEAID